MNEDDSSKTEMLNDSILFYHNISMDKTLALNKRLNAINKSLFLLKASDKDTIYSQLLYKKNRLLFSLEEYDSLHVSNLELINHALQIKDDIFLGKQYYLMAYYFDKIANNSSETFQNYNTSKNYFSKKGDSSWIGKCLYNMGTIQKNKNDFFGSKESLTEALQYLNNKKDSKYISSCYNALGTNHRKLLNYIDALKYYAKAIETANSKKDKLIYQNNLAATYIDNEQYKKAIAILESISKDSLTQNSNQKYARVLDNLAYAKWLSGLNQTEDQFIKALWIRKKEKDQRGQIASYTHLGEFYTRKNPSKAKAYFDSVIQLSKKLKIPRAEKDALKFLMKIDTKNVFIRDRYVTLNDSLYQQELRVKTQFAKYKYDDKLKQESILRLEKENAEKELETSEQRNQKILYLGGFLFITSVFGLSLYGFRQRTKRLKLKNKTERLAAIQETEAELSRKLHDDHGGKLNKVMSLIQRNADKGLILDTVEGIYNHARDFSRELNSVDTGPNFWNGLKATLKYTKPAEVDMTFDGGNELDWSLVGHQTKTMLFKVLQELVINMARHSKAQQTVILFKDLNKELFIYYEDDGVGASKEALFRKNGLQNTEKRIQAIDGIITFDSEEGKGFRAEIRIPK